MVKIGLSGGAGAVVEQGERGGARVPELNYVNLCPVMLLFTPFRAVSDIFTMKKETLATRRQTSLKRRDQAFKGK